MDYTHLAEALAAAQGEMTAATKDATNPHFRSTFASLASVLDAVRGPLSRHGIALVQPGYVDDGGWVHVKTALLWRDQREEMDLKAKPAGTDPQKVGSAMTYLRRYGAMSMCGIAPDDDDGEQASAPAARQQPQQRPQQRRQETPKAKPATDPNEYTAGPNMRVWYQMRLQELDVDAEAVKAYLRLKASEMQRDVVLPRQMSEKQLRSVVERLKDPALKAAVENLEVASE